MGSAMAQNIAKAGHTVRAWNRSAGEPIDHVARVGAVEDVFDADVIVTMLPDDAAIREVILDAGLLDQARGGAVHLVCSTISVAFAEELATRHGEKGVRYVAAPVLGRPDGRRQGRAQRPRGWRP